MRSGTSGTEWIPFQLVTVLKSFGPVIRSQVVSFLALGSEVMRRFKFDLEVRGGNPVTDLLEGRAT